MKEYFYNLAIDRNQGFWASLVKFLLFLASLIYGALIRGLSFFYLLRPARLSCKVISIGNITVGGTGKTSLVEFVARLLKNKGKRVVILSRGYGKDSDAMADEPLMLSNNLGDVPVIVDHNRVRGAEKAIKEYGADTVILDDGMQQWRVKKDLEILAVNASYGLGNRHMLPRGLLREPVSSLKRANIFVLTKVNLAQGLEGLENYLSGINPQASIIESNHEPLGFDDLFSQDKLLDINYLRGKSVVLFSGIGDPDSFAGLIKSLGIEVSSDIRFGDHHNYNEVDLSVICAKAGNSKILITTQKDAVRLSNAKLGLLRGFQVLALRIGLKITNNEKEFTDRLLGLYPF